MIITKTPYRISFFGGGTDYPEWYKNHGGSVLSTTIDKYCYISCRDLPHFFPTHNYRIIYSKEEICYTVDQIQHPSVREGLKMLHIDNFVEIHHDGDLPARSGIGSSSSFTVGLLLALHGLQGKMISKKQLAQEATYLEQNLLKECVGCQDQLAATYGGLNNFKFYGNQDFTISPITISKQRKEELESHLMLFYTGCKRTQNASDIAKTFVCKLPTKKEQMFRMMEMVDEAINILNSEQSILHFGHLMNEGWNLKKDLGDQISNNKIDNIYKRAISAGALGGKLIGAGEGGFMLVFAEPEYQNNIKKELSGLLHVPLQFEAGGSQIIYYDE